MSSYIANVSFKCNDLSIDENSINVTVTLNNALVSIPKKDSYLWETTLNLSGGDNVLILEASTTSKINKVVLTIVTLEQFQFSIEYFLIICGVLMFLSGIILVHKERKEFIYY
jgi:hypothetical protein